VRLFKIFFLKKSLFSFLGVCLGFFEKSFYQKKSILILKWKAIRICFS